MKIRRLISGILCILIVLSLGTSAFAGGISKESNSAVSRRQYGVLPIRDVFASSELMEKRPRAGLKVVAVTELERA